MAYAMCFFPVVGVFIGLAIWGWLALSSFLGFGEVLAGAVASLLPLAVSGGIHMDGFLDVSDALMSHADRARRLEIMKDSHAGAGAVIGGAVYCLLFFALWAEAARGGDIPHALLLAPALSRALSALAVASFKSARGNGLLASFKGAADAAAVRITSALWIAACCALMIVLSGVAGGAAALGCLIAFGIYALTAYRLFGGTTGDLAGWFVQLSELFAIAAFMIARGMMGVL